MTPLAAKTLEVARGEIGVSEVPRGSNGGLRVQVYQDFIGRWVEHQSWCAAFAVWCAYHAAHVLKLPDPQVMRTASSSALYRWAVATGNLLVVPEPGCIGLVKGGPTGHEHTFLVEATAGLRVISIDGNWGDAVRRVRSHRVADCDFARIV